MNLHFLLNLFISGVILGSSVCAISCGWVFFPIVFESQQTRKRSLLKFMLFHSGKIFSYTIIGGLAGFSSDFVSVFKTSRISLFFGGVFFLIMGLLELLMPDKYRIKIKGLSAGFLGALVGFIPCVALVGVLVYLAFVATDFLQGAIAGFVFGLGNAINPFILLAIFAPSCSTRVENIITNKSIYRIGSACVFLFWSITIFWRAYQ
ncbi:MAG: sulfite exporter TauE/SafE family protein [Candidatus Omnitrophica bacterium]|nr:sulfite exporter TauE/SafE family protein [Candidatus Omnitrophota bacterium]MCM8788733.1 sulfite exporter TauE/SafE family protein [Candidatus Omnitrophota bacterium]